MHAATLECKIFSNQHLLFDSVLQLLEKIQVSVSEIKDSIATCPVASNFGGHLNPLLEHDPENLVRNPSLQFRVSRTLNHNSRAFDNDNYYFFLFPGWCHYHNRLC